MKEQIQSAVIIAVIIAILGSIFTYPTILPVVHSQGSTEILPLKIIDGKQSSIKFENDGKVPVIINVNFSSDGSIQFKTDNRQIKDSIDVRYSINANDIGEFKFIPIFNTSSENATLIVNYRSTLKHLNLPTRNPENIYIGNYEKTVTIAGIGDQWEII